MDWCKSFPLIIVFRWSGKLKSLSPESLELVTGEMSTNIAKTHIPSYIPTAPGVAKCSTKSQGIFLILYSKLAIKNWF